MPTSAAINTTDNNGLVYVGISLTQDGVFATSTPSISSTVFKSSGSLGYGLLAFVVGVILACCCWVANQGWTLVSLLAFGQFEWTLEGAWKHILLSVFGACCTSIAFWAVFKMIFPNILEEDDREDDVKDEPALFKRDISDALQDLGELGFVVGYFGSQTFLVTLMYKPLVGLGFDYESSNDALNGATLAFVMVWVLCTKMRDYKRAVNRANNVERVESLAYYAQIV